MAAAKSLPDVRFVFCQLMPNDPFPNILQDPEKLKARAARFGIQHGQSRSAIAEDVDAEEAERRRKRAERFGLT